MLPNTSRESFTIHGNQQKNILLRVPSRGTIRNIVIVQVVGDNEGFAFEIFTKRAVAPPDGRPVPVGMEVEVEAQSLTSDLSSLSSHSASEFSSSVSSSEAGETLPGRLFSVMGRKSSAGQTFEEFNKEYIYVCDGGPTNRKRELYMRFTPGGSDENVKHFEMKLDIAIAGMVN